MSNFDMFFGGGGDSSVVPRFTRKRALINKVGGAAPDGFVGDGDYVVLPSSSSGNLIYINSAGTTVWTKTPTQLFAGATNVVAFTLTSGLIYCVTTASGSFFLSTINAAGTVTQIGAGFTPSPALTTPDYWSPDNTPGCASCSITGTTLEVLLDLRSIKVNITTGALVSDAFAPVNKGAFVSNGVSLRATGNAPATVPGVDLTLRRGLSSSRFATAAIIAPYECGIPDGINTGGVRPRAFLSWKGELVLFPFPGGAVFDPATLASDVSVFTSNLNFYE